VSLAPSLGATVRAASGIVLLAPSLDASPVLAQRDTVNVNTSLKTSVISPCRGRRGTRARPLVVVIVIGGEGHWQH